jgi:hypothetical protein
MPSLDQLKTNFQKRYGLDMPFDEMLLKGKQVKDKFKGLDEFLNKASEKNPAKKEYLAGLFYMLRGATENQIKPASKKSAYNLNDFNAIQFIRDYEEIMAAKHAEANPKAPRKPHEGLALEILNRAANHIKGYNKPLAEIWGERIFNNQFDLEKMMEMTDRIHSSAENAISIAPLIDDDDMDAEVSDSRKSVETAIMIREAIKVSKEKRTFRTYLWAGNWKRFKLEKNYMKALDKQISDYEKWEKNIVAETLEKYKDPIPDASDKILEHKDNIIAEHKKNKLAANESAKINDNASQRENLNLDKSLGEIINDSNISPKIDSIEASFTSKELNK